MFTYLREREAERVPSTLHPSAELDSEFEPMNLEVTPGAEIKSEA